MSQKKVKSQASKAQSDIFISKTQTYSINDDIK